MFYNIFFYLKKKHPLQTQHVTTCENNLSIEEKAAKKGLVPETVSIITAIKNTAVKWKVENQSQVLHYKIPYL